MVPPSRPAWMADVAGLLTSPGETRRQLKGSEHTRERFPLSEKWSANHRSRSFLDRWASFISAPLLQANLPPLIPFVPVT